MEAHRSIRTVVGACVPAFIAPVAGPERAVVRTAAPEQSHEESQGDESHRQEAYRDRRRGESDSAHRVVT